MKTDSITIGRDPALTMAIVKGVAARREKQQRRERWKQKLRSLARYLIPNQY